MAPVSVLISVGNIGKQSNLTSALDSGRKFTLMLCTSSGNSSGKDLSTLGNELSELCGILIVNVSYLVGTEYANLFSFAVDSDRALYYFSLGVIHLMKTSCYNFVYPTVSERQVVVTLDFFKLRRICRRRERGIGIGIGRVLTCRGIFVSRIHKVHLVCDNIGSIALFTVIVCP